MWYGNYWLLIRFFFYSIFPLPSYTQCKIFHLLPVLLSTAGETFHPFLQCSTHASHQTCCQPRLDTEPTARASCTERNFMHSCHRAHEQWIHTNFPMTNYIVWLLFSFMILKVFLFRIHIPRDMKGESSCLEAESYDSSLEEISIDTKYLFNF